MRTRHKFRGSAPQEIQGVIAASCVPFSWSMNLAQILADAADSHSGRTALWCEGVGVSYGELERRARVAAGALRDRGMKPGDRIALMLPNGPGFVAAYFGALRLGATVVPMNTLLADPEIQERVSLSTPRAFVTEELPTNGEPFYEIVGNADTDPAVILFTSGTSGRPKGAVLTHGGITAAARNAAEALVLAPEDVVLGAAPFSHVLGQSTGLVATLLAGAAVSVLARFEPASALATMTATRTSILLGVPAMCRALCQVALAATELPPLRIAHVGGAPVPAEVAREFEHSFGCEMYEGYGLTELSGIATTYVAGQAHRDGSVGMPLGETEMRISSSDAGLGEVQFRGPSVIPGYWQDPDATAQAIAPDGWLSTGDVGYVDDDGYLYLVDRLKELILRGGYNVYPREVEEVLYAHPDVLEAAVVAIPHDILGEEVGAVIVPRPGSTTSPEEIQRWVKSRVAAYKYPRCVAFAVELPKGATGKVLKRAIDRDDLASHPIRS